MDQNCREGARPPFVYVGPRLNLTAANADSWLSLRPGTEGILALGLVHVILQERLAAPPVHMTEFVLLPKMRPLPPVAITTASARNARIVIERRSWATMPWQTPFASRIGRRNSQCSYLVTLPSAS